jgi:hypothetical protein
MFSESTGSTVMDELLTRMAQNIFGRIDGPLAMRLILQPFMAAFFASRDGIRDAREERPPYGWSLLFEPEHRGHRIRDGWRSIRKVFVAALLVDIVYQIIELRWIFVGEALVMAEALALVPYVLLRGPANRIARLWLHR